MEITYKIENEFKTETDNEVFISKDIEFIQCKRNEEDCIEIRMGYLKIFIKRETFSDMITMMRIDY